jgi:hypothetical protein
MIDRLTIPLLFAALAVGCATSPPQAGSPLEGHTLEQAGPVAEHAWLTQLVGTWEVTNQADMGPDAPPMEMKATETVRAIGDLWIQTELVGESEGGSVTGVMTVGFDPKSGRFLGTWIDSTQPRLWTYDGELDEARTTLSLYAEGPDFQDPTITRMYRDATTVLAPGHRRFSSSVQNDDGTWTVFMSGEARRIGG